MKITTNLLPPKQKSEIRFERTQSFIIMGIVSVFIVTFSIIALFFGMEILVENKLKIIQDQVMAKEEQIEKEKVGKLETDIKDLNRYLKRLDGIQKGHLYWSDILKNLIELVPGGVKIASLSANQEDRRIEIQGNANTRDQLLNFEENLRNSKIFEGVESPLSNIVKKENVDFEITFYLKEEALTKE